MQTEILKEIARRYTEKYYPEFLHRFDRVWGLLRSANLKKFSIQEFQWARGIEFADNVDDECVEWMRDLYIFGRLEVIHNILYSRAITKTELVRHLTRICNHLKLSPAIAKKKVEETADFILSLLEDDYPTVIKKKENLRLLVTDKDPEYVVWESIKGDWRASLKKIEALKESKSITLLLDENNEIFVNGKNKTMFFAKKPKSLASLIYLLENKGSCYIDNFIDGVNKMTKKGKKLKRSNVSRRIRYLNSILKELGIINDIIFILGDRVYIPSNIKLCLIRKINH